MIATALFHSLTRFDRGSGVENLIFGAKNAALNSYGNAPKGEGVADSVSVGTASDSDRSRAQGGFQGLPARIEIPSDGQSHYFSQGLIDERGQIRLSAVMVGMSVLGGLSALLGLVSCFALFRRKELLLRALRFG
jgi:hypothetical protein